LAASALVNNPVNRNTPRMLVGLIAADCTPAVQLDATLKLTGNIVRTVN